MDGRKTGAGALETAAIPACADDDNALTTLTTAHPGESRDPGLTAGLVLNWGF